MKKIVVVASLCVLAMAQYTLAQETILVPYEHAYIAWEAPQNDTLPDGVGPTKWHAINCGAGDIKFDMPTISVSIKAVAPKPGAYACTLWAGNEFGKSEPTNIPKFNAGSIPAAAGNVRLEVR